MKKIGLITIHRILNYGSALQTFATVRVLNSLNFQCEVIDYEYPNTYHLSNAPYHKQKKRRVSIVSKILRRICRIIIKENIENIENIELKKSKFDSFLNENLSFSKDFKTIESLNNEPPEYDIYITGSDQVWNPKYCHDDTTFLLGFVRNKAKKIAFGASFGANYLSENYRLVYRKFLDQYDYISVREESGKSIVKELVNKEASTVLDPTLLLSALDWNKEANQKKLFSEPYIFCYLLGYSFDPFPYTYQLIKYLKRKLGMQAVFIGGDTYYATMKGNKVLPNAGPREYLSLFRDAKFVVTTSFHGTAFSINYSKPFFTIINDEPTPDDRQISLVKKLGIQNRVLVKGQPFGENLDLEMDYSKIKTKLDMERSKSISFLQDALSEN